MTKDKTLEAIIAGAKANGSWDKKYPDDDKKAQPAQEPVAYCYVQKGTSVDILTFDAEPDDAVTGTLFPLYCAPPQRPWIGLTDEERHYIELGIEVFGLSITEILLEAENKLKDKNT